LIIGMVGKNLYTSFSLFYWLFLFMMSNICPCRCWERLTAFCHRVGMIMRGERSKAKWRIWKLYIIKKLCTLIPVGQVVVVRTYNSCRCVLSTVARRVWSHYKGPLASVHSYHDKWDRPSA
jgi:hypothetical protein